MNNFREKLNKFQDLVSGKSSLHNTKPKDLNFNKKDSNIVSEDKKDSSDSLFEYLNVRNEEKVHQRVILIHGKLRWNFRNSTQLSITNSDYPSFSTKIVNSHFKILIPLHEQVNLITFSCGSVSNKIKLVYEVLHDNPPLRLVVMKSYDSPEVYDLPSTKSHEQGLENVVKKFRMISYLWQAFIAEDMARNGFGRRTFQLEEEMGNDTVVDDGKYRKIAKVHIITSSLSLKEIQDPLVAQQYDDSKGNQKGDKNKLYNVFMDTLKRSGLPEGHYAGLILDSKWDPDQQLIRGHAALGGCFGQYALGIFGSHTTYAWPRNLKEVSPCFLDDRSVDRYEVSNDCGECGLYFKAANVGIGAFLHEVGHAFGLAHTPQGIMSRGFNDLNKMFMIEQPGQACILPNQTGKAHFHRVDIIKLRHHAVFKFPTEKRSDETGVLFYNIDEDIAISSSFPIRLIEFWLNERMIEHMEFLEDDHHEVRLHSSQLSSRLDQARRDTLCLEVLDSNNNSGTLSNVCEFLQAKDIMVSQHLQAHRSIRLGHGNTPNSRPLQFIFPSTTNPHIRISNIRIHHGAFIDGLIFTLSSGEIISFGNATANRTDFSLDHGEALEQILIRVGAWVDGLELVTSKQRKSGWFGGKGSTLYCLKAPREFRLVGIFGSAGPWLDSFGILYSRF